MLQEQPRCFGTAEAADSQPAAEQCEEADNGAKLAPSAAGQQAWRHEEEWGVVQRDAEGSTVPSKLNSVQGEGRSSFRNGSTSLSRLSLMATSPKTPIIVTLFSQLVPVLSWPVCWENQAAK